VAQKFTVPVTVKQLSSTGSDAITVFVDADTYARLKIEAGGRLTWGSGSGAGDANLYRDEADTLKTDDNFKVGGKLSVTASSGDEGGEIFLAQAATNTTLAGGITIDSYQNKIRFFEQGGDARGAYIDLTACAGGAGTNLLSGGGGATTLDGLTDVTAPSPSSGDFLKYNGTAWVNDPINLGTDTTGDYVASLVAGTAISITNNSGEGATPTVTLNAALNDLTDTVITSPEEFQGLSYNGTNWVNSHIPLVSYVRNAESTTITTGTCVYLFGAAGDHATVKRADKSSETTSSKTIGVAGASIAASNNGPIVTRGYVDGIDLSSGYTAGDILWLGDDGAFTTTKPSAPDNLVFIGVVVRATNNGIIYVATQNGYELDELHDVSIVDKASGDFLKYNGTLWVNDAINLGTDTVGNYVSDVTAGTGVTVTHTPSEGSSPTIAIGQAVGTASNVTFNSVTSTGNVIKHVDINARTASYTLVLSDDGKLVEMGVASANTLTIPPNADVAFPVGTSIDILQTGAGKTQIVAGSGVTANSANGLYLRAQWSAVTLIKRATNTWVVFGDTSTS